MPKTHQNLLTEKQQERLYLVHHMHHVMTGKGIIHQELHHCFLYSKKGMSGNKYSLKHLFDGGKLYHVLDKAFSGTLYDHLNRCFKTALLKIRNKRFSEIK